jgi:hypothetical protein
MMPASQQPTYQMSQVPVTYLPQAAEIQAAAAAAVAGAWGASMHRASTSVSLGQWAHISGTPSVAPLEPSLVYELLCDVNFRPGARPTVFSRNKTKTWIFKEGKLYVRPCLSPHCSTLSLISFSDFSWCICCGQHVRGKAAAGKQSDRWHNSGGSKAARDLPTGAAKIRRRYGSIAQADGNKYRYHEYKLVIPTTDLRNHHQQVIYEEDKSCVLYHVMLPLGEDPAEGDSDSESSSQDADTKEKKLLSTAAKSEAASGASSTRSKHTASDRAATAAELEERSQPARQQKKGGAQSTPQWAQKSARTKQEAMPEVDKPKACERPDDAARRTTSTGTL